MMISSSAMGQERSFLDILKNSNTPNKVNILCYQIDDEDMTTQVENASFVLRDGFIECRLGLKDSMYDEFWSFKIDSVLCEEKIIKASLSEISHENTNWVYLDEKAIGSYTFTKGNTEETIHIKFHVHNSEQDVTIRWRSLENEE